MALEFDLIVDPGLTYSAASALQELVAFAGEREACPPTGAWSCAVRLTTDAEIAAIHQRFFGDSAATDVISFPSGEALDGESGYLGDIVISVETAADQAQDAGHSIEREVALLVLHGLLHLCGYDDATNAERNAMHVRQEELLAHFEATHGRPW